MQARAALFLSSTYLPFLMSLNPADGMSRSVVVPIIPVQTIQSCGVEILAALRYDAAWIIAMASRTALAQLSFLGPIIVLNHCPDHVELEEVSNSHGR